MWMDDYRLQAPVLTGSEMSEAEVLGAAVWLWMHSGQHRDFPLYALPTVLLPAIKRQQYAITSHNDRPVLYLSWMWLDVKAEHRYLTQPHILTQDDEWASGNRLWIRDFIAPFGLSAAMRRIVTSALFPDDCFRSLWHRGEERGKRVINFHGKNISSLQAREWRAAHPLAVRMSEE